ncbi:thioredoxin-2-like [Teleopsis dalmanni]|uniref:thioredoxin-2-like n=1 Tax=Teleopsis dalmanni TaxID=139649 RepID=UPI0018CF9AD2|nr:thioredoxin-2-like [Teleopsis dalmanni]
MVYVVKNRQDFNMKMAEAGNKLVVLDFCATWCGPCRIISPKVEELAGTYAAKAVVLKINVDECEELAMEYNVTSMPTFIFIKNGIVVDSFVGGNAEKLVKNMAKYAEEVCEPNAVTQ